MVTDHRAAAVQRLLNDVGGILGYPRGWKSALAERFDIARETLSSLVNGRSSPSDDTLRAIEEVLHVSPDYWDAPNEPSFVDFVDDTAFLNFALNLEKVARQAERNEIETRLARLRSRPSKVLDRWKADPEGGSPVNDDETMEARARKVLVAYGQGDEALVLQLAPQLALDVIESARNKT